MLHLQELIVVVLMEHGVYYTGDATTAHLKTNREP